MEQRVETKQERLSVFIDTLKDYFLKFKRRLVIAVSRFIHFPGPCRGLEEKYFIDAGYEDDYRKPNFC
jgi:hypothetical protein